MSLAQYPLAVRGLAWPVMKTHEFGTIVEKAPNFFTTRIVQSQNPIWHWTLVYNYLKDNPLDLVPALSPHTDYRYLEGFLLSNQGQFAEFLFDDLSDDTFGMRSQLGGGSTSPSVIRPNSDYIAGSYIVDDNSTPHLQLVTQPGHTTGTIPSFSTGGGNTNWGTAVFTDQGVFSGANAQTASLVNDGMPTPTYYTPIQRNFGGQFLEDITDLNTSVYPLAVWANGVLKTNGVDYTVGGPGLSIPGHSYQGLYLTWAAPPTAPITILGQFFFRVRLESDSQDIEQFMQQLWTVGGPDSKNGSGMLKLESSRVALV